jgi:hypothetical protein
VILSDVCKRTEFCDIGGAPNDVFYKGADVNATCKVRTTISGTRFPGEACDDKNLCYKPDGNDTKLGTCENNVCLGYKNGEDCKATSWCLAGNYCDKTTLKCASLKNEKENCTLTTECKNNLLCFNGTCQDAWYSFPEGVLVTGKGDFNPAFYCKSGIATNGVCDSHNSTDVVNNQTNLVQCDPSQACNYTSINGAFSKNCECGYNPDGLSYCPRGQNLGNYIFQFITEIF